MLAGVHALRFVAATSVVVAHVRSEFDILPVVGTYGVDLFFVISGFIIAYVTERDATLFFVKRVARVVPLYWAVTIAVAVVAFAAPGLLRSTEFDFALLFYSLAFVPNHFGDTAFLPMMKIGWTLNYEMLFYLVFYGAMKISHRFRSAICAAFLAGLAATHPLTDETSAFYFWSDAIILEFVIGMAVYHLYRRTTRVPFPFIALIVCLIALPATQIMLSEETLFFPVRPYVWGLLAGGALLCALHAEPIFSKGLMRPLSVRCGDWSYSIYLVHLYVIAALHRALGFDGFGSPVVFFFAVMILTMMISYLTYRTIETAGKNLVLGFAGHRVSTRR